MDIHLADVKVTKGIRRINRECVGRECVGLKTDTSDTPSCNLSGLGKLFSDKRFLAHRAKGVHFVHYRSS